MRQLLLVSILALGAVMLAGCGDKDAYDANYSKEIKMTEEQKKSVEAEAKNQRVPGQAGENSSSVGTMPMPAGKGGR